MAQIVPFLEFGGLDLVSHDGIASPLRCRSCLNVQKRRSKSLARRQGYKAAATNTGNNGGFGVAIYNKKSFTNASVTKEHLVIGSKLYKRNSHTLTVNYGGAGSAVCEVIVDVPTGTWRFKLYENSVVVLNYDMGVGFDEASIKTIANLLTAINAVTNFTATAPTGTTLPAAFLPYVIATQVLSSVAITYSELVEVNHPTSATAPFAGAFANRNASEFENVSHVQIDNVIIFGSKWDSQQKYDGVDCYRSGMPLATTPTGVEAATGALANGVYKAFVTCVQLDAQGNEIEGIESGSVTVTTVAGKGINYTLTNVLATTGFNTDCAIVNGAQVAQTTLNVDNNLGGLHTMKVGQTAYFLDSISGGYVTRTITAKTNTTITISGAAVTVADNAVISNNLRLRLYRTVASGTIYKFNVDIPNNSFSATQVYLDAKADASLGFDYVSPSLDGVEHGLPPHCGYLAVYDGSVVAAGDMANPDSFYFTSPDGPEYYPASFKDTSQSGDNLPITGLSSGDRFFWVQKQETSFFVSGKLATGQYTCTEKGDAVGCLAHATIVKADTSLYWLGEGGVYRSQDGGTPVDITPDIMTVFDNAGLATERQLMFKRAVAVYDKHTKFYMLFLPAESSQGGEVYANQYSRIFAFDTIAGEWWEWGNPVFTMNWAGGIAHDEKTGEMVWVERRYSTFSSTMAFQLYARLNTNTQADYVDHVTDIPWSYEPAGSIDLGVSDVDKKFLYAIFDAADPQKTPNYVLICQIEKDNQRGIYQTVLSTTMGTGTSATSGWGFESWGFFPWGMPRNGLSKPRRLMHGKATSIRPIFSASGIYSEIVLSSMKLLVEAPFKIDIAEARSG